MILPDSPFSFDVLLVARKQFACVFLKNIRVLRHVSSVHVASSVSRQGTCLQNTAHGAEDVITETACQNLLFHSNDTYIHAQTAEHFQTHVSLSLISQALMKNVFVVLAGNIFSAGPVSLDTRWQQGHLHLIRIGSLAADLAHLQPQTQWMQV
jgi:hypothetical protein